MRKYAVRLRSLLDLLVTLALGAAAVALLWRMTTGANTSVAPGERPARLAAVDDLRKSGLSISLDGTKTKGSTSARIVMVEFTDFECPFCARFVLETFDKLQEEFVSEGRVQYAFRHAPMKTHSLARPAAQAAECAARQGRFWDARDYLFRNQARLALALWFKSNGGLSMDASLFEACMAGSDEAQIDADLLEASRFKIEATPTFLIGKRMSDGRIVVLSRINGNQAYDVFREALAAADVDSL
jgi:protein-disulfide isomerase